MTYFSSAAIGIVLGIIIIVFSKKICMYIEKSYMSFPKYKDGIKTFDIHFTIRPVFIVLLGCLIITFSLVSMIVNF